MRKTYRRGLPLLALFFAIIFTAQPAWASASSPWRYDLTVWVNDPSYTANMCERAAILDTAVNLANVQTHSTSSCTSSSLNVPSGYLGSNAYGYRDGSFCGSSGNYYSSTATWGFQVSYQACSNPAGTQTFYTIGYDAIYNDGSGGGAVGYNWFSQSSPSQNY